MRKLLAVTSLTGLLTLIKMAAGFLVGKVVAIYIGPSGLAMLGQLQSCLTILNGMVNSPVGSGIVRFTAQHNTHGYENCIPWWRASILWVLFISILLIVSVFFLGSSVSLWLFNTNEYTAILYVTAIALPITAIGTLINSVINGQQQYRRFVFIGIMSVTVSTSVMIFLIINYRISGALLAVALQNGLIGVIAIILSLKSPWFKLKFWLGRTSRTHLKDIAGYIAMAISSAICMPVALLVIRKILIHYTGWDSTGQWQAVWKISEAYLAVVTLALGTYFLPKLAILHEAKDIKKEIFKTAQFIMPLVAAMGLVIFISKDFIISLLFTEEFSQARKLFAYQIVGDFIKILSWLFAYPMLSKGKVKWYVMSEIFSAVTFITLGAILIKNFGSKGAVIAYMFNYLIYLIFIMANFKRIIK